VSSGGSIGVSSSSVAGEACTALKNHGSFFSANIKVGTNPGKSFDVVADTGSNSVIVASCNCSQVGSCDAKDPCLKCDEAKTDSKTLHVNVSAGDKVPIVVMAFGSGKIESMVGTDEVAVGGIKATLTDQLLLMVDKKLNFKDVFEGILGLGIPEAKRSGDDWSKKAGHGVQHKETGEKYVVKGFLEMVSPPVTRFSMCFQDSGDGALRLNTPALTEPMPSVGEAHWGLDFRGITVGGTPSTGKTASFCQAGNLAAGQQTPCGAIPDSGTTLIMGPGDQLKTLYEEICDAWPKCQEAMKAKLADPETGKEMPKYEVVQVILANCSGWIGTAATALDDELPDLHFHIRGKDQTTNKDLTFKGSDYIEMGEVDPEAMKQLSARTTLSKEPMPAFLQRHTKHLGNDKVKVCMLAMDTMEYQTAANGPVWILGTPLFYGFQVSYDLAATPPAIQIKEETCSACSGGSTSLMRDFMEDAPAQAATLPGQQRARRISGKPRRPSQPLNGPL